MAKKSKQQDTTVDIVIDRGRIEVGIIGTTPMILNRMSEKARQGLLLPKGGKKTAQDKAANMKHNPLEEYRGSIYKAHDRAGPSLIAVPASMFKRAITSASLDMEGTKKTETGRLSWVEGAEINIFGVQQMLMSMVRTADMARTPDVRTRAILPRWACAVSISYIGPKLNATILHKLITQAGLSVGIGDWRQEKGSGNFGQFSIVDASTLDDYKAIIASGGRDAQVAAYNHPAQYDDETSELYAYWNTEVEQRGLRVVTTFDEIADDGADDDDSEAAE